MLSIYSEAQVFAHGVASSPWALIWSMIFVLWIKIFRPTGFVSILLRLIGTILHEGMHWIFALLLFGRPTGFSVVPVRQPDGSIQLGEVRISNLKWWNGLFIGCAPLLLSAMGLWLVSLGDSAAFGERNILTGFVASQCFLSCWPSRQDLRLAGQSAMVYGLIGLAMWIAVGM